MKKIIQPILLACFLFAFSSPSFATTWYAQNGSGNMSTRTWNDASGGGGTALTWNNQAAGDIFEANGQTAIAIDVDPQGTGASKGKVILKTLSGGGFTYATAANLTMTMDVVAGTSDCIATSGTTGGGIITGDVTGGSTSASSGLALAHSTVTLYVQGTVRGGTYASAYGAEFSANTRISALNALGDVGHGMYTSSAGTVIVITGTTTGSASTADVYGVKNSSATGTVTCLNATGGAANGADGIRSVGAGVATVTGIITNTLTASGASGQVTYAPADNTKHVVYGANEFVEITNSPATLAAATIKSGTVAGSVTGTYAVIGSTPNVY